MVEYHGVGRRSSIVGDGSDVRLSKRRRDIPQTIAPAGDDHRPFKRPRCASSDQQQRVVVVLNKEASGGEGDRHAPPLAPPPTTLSEKVEGRAATQSDEKLLRRAMMLDRFKHTIVKAEVQLLHINDLMKEKAHQDLLLKKMEQESCENRRRLREAARRSLQKMEEEAAQRIDKEVLLLPENLWFLGSTDSDYRPLSPTKWS